MQSGRGQDMAVPVPPLPEVIPAAPITAPAPSPVDLKDLQRRIEFLEKPPPPKKPTIVWTSQIQADAVSISQDAQNLKRYGVIPDGAVFRRARIGLMGDYGQVDYRLEMDFALSGRPSFLDLLCAFDIRVCS